MLDVEALTAEEGRGWRERVADGDLRVGDRFMRFRTTEEVEEGNGGKERRVEVVVVW